MKKSIHSKRYDAFCEQLISARKSAGLTQVQVSERLDKPQSFVAKYEGGERRLDVIEFIEIAETLNIDAPKLLTELLKKV